MSMSIVWTCDRCGTERGSGSVDPERVPKDWHRIETTTRDGYHAVSGAMCPECYIDMREWWGEKR